MRRNLQHHSGCCLRRRFRIALVGIANSKCQSTSHFVQFVGPPTSHHQWRSCGGSCRSYGSSTYLANQTVNIAWHACSRQSSLHIVREHIHYGQQGEKRACLRAKDSLSPAVCEQKFCLRAKDFPFSWVVLPQQVVSGCG